MSEIRRQEVSFKPILLYFEMHHTEINFTT